MADTWKARFTGENPELATLCLRWAAPGLTANDGIGPLASLHQAGDALVAVTQMTAEGWRALGSGVMVGPGLVLTATHVLDEFPDKNTGPVCVTFLPDGARVWLPFATVHATGASPFDVLGRGRKMRSDLAVLSCALFSDALASSPLTLAPIELCLPMPGERLWAYGFRDFCESGGIPSIAPFVSSGIVQACFPNGRGERMPSPCLEVSMEALGGMSGGPVFNERDRLVGLVSSSVEGGPTYITLVWDAMRHEFHRLQSCVWPDGRGTLWSGAQLGLVRLYGRFTHQDGDTTLDLSPEEMALLQEHASLGPHPST